MQVVSHGRRDAIIFLLSNDKAGGCIQDGPEWTHADCTGGAKNAVAVIHATDDKRMDQRSGSLDGSLDVLDVLLSTHLQACHKM